MYKFIGFVNENYRYEYEPLPDNAKLIDMKGMNLKSCVAGSAEASAEYLFPKEGYDLVVDTGGQSPEENARLIFTSFFD